MHIWTENVVRPIRDELLVRSAREFRQLIDHVDGTKPSCQGRYLQEVRRGLRLMKEELARRGLEAEALIRGTMPRQAATRGAEHGPGVVVQHKSYVWKKLVGPPASARAEHRDRPREAPSRLREKSSGRPAVSPHARRGA